MCSGLLRRRRVEPSPPPPRVPDKADDAVGGMGAGSGADGGTNVEDDAAGRFAAADAAPGCRSEGGPELSSSRRLATSLLSLRWNWKRCLARVRADTGWTLTIFMALSGPDKPSVSCGAATLPPYGEKRRPARLALEFGRTAPPEPDSSAACATPSGGGTSMLRSATRRGIACGCSCSAAATREGRHDTYQVPGRFRALLVTQGF